MQSILIVEDDVIICGGIKVYLENHGYEAFCVYSVSEAKDKPVSYTHLTLPTN